MTTTAIHQLLGDLADTHEIVLRGAESDDPLLTAWRIAAEDAGEAYAGWCAHPSPLSYAVYLAMADQADAAASTLAVDRRAAASRVGPHAPRRLAA